MTRKEHDELAALAVAWENRPACDNAYARKDCAKDLRVLLVRLMTKGSGR